MTCDKVVYSGVMRHKVGVPRLSYLVRSLSVFVAAQGAGKKILRRTE
jgi:hypothetical protein